MVQKLQDQITCAAALAAHLLNRPVRFIMTNEAMMAVVGKRYASVTTTLISIRMAKFKSLSLITLETSDVHLTNQVSV